jgi:hypothetical protein
MHKNKASILLGYLAKGLEDRRYLSITLVSVVYVSGTPEAASRGYLSRNGRLRQRCPFSTELPIVSFERRIGIACRGRRICQNRLFAL